MHVYPCTPGLLAGRLYGSKLLTPFGLLPAWNLPDGPQGLRTFSLRAAAAQAAAAVRQALRT